MTTHDTVKPRWLAWLLQPVAFHWLYEWWFDRDLRAWALLLGGWTLSAIGVAMYLGWGAFVILMGLLILGLFGLKVVWVTIWLGTLGEEDEPVATHITPREPRRGVTLFKGKRITG